MVVREIQERHWKHVRSQITTHGRAAPLSLQFDIDINCNGVNYILKVQLGGQQKVYALQALGVYPDGGGTGGKEFHLIENHAVLSALLELVIYQGAGARRT